MLSCESYFYSIIFIDYFRYNRLNNWYTFFIYTKFNFCTQYNSVT